VEVEAVEGVAQLPLVTGKLHGAGADEAGALQGFANLVVFFQDDYPETGRGYQARCAAAGRSGADYCHVAVLQIDITTLYKTTT
jgi:hypothetical protein